MDQVVYRNQKGRYPCWVKTVDNITIETDKQDSPEIGLKYHFGKKKMLRLRQKKWG